MDPVDESIERVVIVEVGIPSVGNSDFSFCIPLRKAATPNATIPLDPASASARTSPSPHSDLKPQTHLILAAVVREQNRDIIRLPC